MTIEQKIKRGGRGPGGGGNHVGVDQKTNK
jgi:hypothetical protein